MGVRDDYVKAVGREHEYTPEQIKELVKCKNDVLYFCNKYVQIVSIDHGVMLFDTYEYQDDLLTKFAKHRFNIALLSRQSGKSTIVSAYALWFGLFHSNKNIGIVSNKEKAAISFLTRLKYQYELLPAWLKPGAVKWAEKSVVFENNTTIQVAATSKDSFRGEPMSLLICDELAFVDPQWKAEEFWASNYPTVSSSKTAKIIIISTPNGMFNRFHILYTGAEAGNNTFIHTKYDWTAVPGRDEEWAKEQKQNLGKVKFEQEFGCKFIGSSNTVIDSAVLELLLAKNFPEPPIYELNNKFRVYEKPKEGAQYVLGCDVAKGTGEHYSTIQVLRIDATKPIKMKQVAVFECNFTDTYTFAEIINRTCYYYNNAYIMCENNGEGAPVVQKLWWDYENPNLINEGNKAAKLGIRATGATKPRAVLLMKKLIEDDCLELCDNGTVTQLADFIDKGNNRFGGGNMDDDLISALYWAVYFLEMDILDSKFEFKADQYTEEDAWGMLDDYSDAEEDWSWLTQ